MAEVTKSLIAVLAARLYLAAQKSTNPLGRPIYRPMLKGPLADVLGSELIPAASAKMDTSCT